MTPTLWTWIAIPLLGGVIGWVTNWIAVKMIFRPIRPRRVLGLTIQGLIGRRQPDLARSIGRVVGGHLVEHEDIVKSFAKVDFERVLGGVLDRGLAPKVQELKGLPLIGGFLTDARVRDIRDALVKGIMAHKDAILEELERGLEQGLDVPALVEQKVAAFPVEKVEALILEVARSELQAITWLGGLLGVVIGLGQVAVVSLAG
jgi:uncharacterized membrane protein YheB (UPF0754 family)